jgi:Fe(3+) dicitrate transport protein
MPQRITNKAYGNHPLAHYKRIGIIIMMLAAQRIWAEPLSTPLNIHVPVTIDLPVQPLAESLKQFAKQSDSNIVFDPNLVQGKLAPAVKGNYDSAQALQKLLSGSGLEATTEDTTILIKRERAKKPDEPLKVEVQPVQVRAKRFYEVGPLPGLGLTKEEIPGNVQSISAEEIKQSHSLSLTDLMNKKLQSVNVNDYQGNPFQMDVTYRGFTAGPQIGTPQGLSVFFDGIRVNEPFGDVVNWDMIPMNAIAGVDVFPGSNPIFGLNTLGGAFTLKTKDGFNNTGVDAEVLAGSYGRKQLQVEAGWNNGTVALFGAGSFFLEDGWRKNSPSEVNQLFTKASYRGEKLDLNLSTLLVSTDLVGNGLVPSEMYAQDSTSVYSSPDTTKNQLGQFQLSSSYFVDESFTITGQVYRRKSKRHQIGADVYTGLDQDAVARRIPSASEQYTCLFTSTNSYGLPDYYVIPVVADPVNGADVFSNTYIQDYLNNNGTTLPDSLKNTELDAAFLAAFKKDFDVYKNFAEYSKYNRDSTTHITIGDTTSYSFNEAVFNASGVWSLGKWPEGTNSNFYFNAGDTYFYTQAADGTITKNIVFISLPTNNANCLATKDLDKAGTSDRPYTYNIPGTTTYVQTIDGALSGNGGVIAEVDPDTGKLYYTPTSILTDNKINQIVDGASVQFNWNLEHHKFMVGASIDAASATYSNTQRLGLLDANRNAYLAPDDIHPMFAGADIDISNNDFSGTNVTKSVYFSETWSPAKTWNFSLSGRYNDTKTKNKIAARYGSGAYEIGDVIAYPDWFNICPNGDCTGVATSYKTPSIANGLNAAETEKFSYYSFNPSLGATWQATENLNVYSNYAQGTRTPSVIELGCAFDKTPVYTGGTNGDRNNPANYTPKSIYENRQCTLPTTLSGDPFLKQIKATTYDMGMRGTWGESTQWNLGAYQTNLKDDIYFVAVGDGQGFFDSIGDTRRRGIEAGFSSKFGKAKLSLNYGLTDATFQNEFLMYSRDNSSAITVNGYGEGVIKVKPGDRMPGVPLHNLNANLTYDLTDKWSVSLNGVLHSESFVRGNENNEHQVGVSRIGKVLKLVDDGTGNQVMTLVDQVLAPTTNPGKVGGYAVFNFQTSYKINKEWTATLLVNNLFDREYYSAGRLGRNPFSPSILGAIGSDGYNHNSNDWRSTNFIAPGAPRGIWFSLNWQFDASK